MRIVNEVRIAIETGEFFAECMVQSRVWLVRVAPVQAGLSKPECASLALLGSGPPRRRDGFPALHRDARGERDEQQRAGKHSGKFPRNRRDAQNAREAVAED